MKKQLPIYDITVDQLNLEQGVGYISLVDEPAIQVDWIKLANEAQLSFKAAKDKQMLYGPFLIPDMLIYRFDQKMGEYYVRFKRDQIEIIASKFNKDLNSKNINFQHSDVKVDAYVAENWLIEGDDKSKNFGFNLPDGTWFGGVKVDDPTFWTDKVKNDEVKGFSVEILADLELELNKIKNKDNQMENEIKLASAKTADGVEIYFDGTLAEKTAVFSDDAMTIPMGDGDYAMEDGSTITVKGGLVETINMAADPNAAPADAGAPAGNAPLTADEVSQMIDARFAEVMNEITAIKDAIAPLIDNAPVDSTEEMSEITKKLASIEEKLASTPGAQSVTKKEPKTALHLDSDKFSKDLERIRMFAKNK